MSKCGDFGWLASPEVINNATIRYNAYNFLFTFYKKKSNNYLVPFLRYSKL